MSRRSGAASRRVRPIRGRDERGSAGGLLTVGICLVVLVMSLAATTIVVWVAQARHAQQAAELAALAGASAAVEGRPAVAVVDQREVDLDVGGVLGVGRGAVRRRGDHGGRGALARPVLGAADGQPSGDGGHLIPGRAGQRHRQEGPRANRGELGE